MAWRKWQASIMLRNGDVIDVGAAEKPRNLFDAVAALAKWPGGALEKLLAACSAMAASASCAPAK